MVNPNGRVRRPSASIGTVTHHSTQQGGPRRRETLERIFHNLIWDIPWMFHRPACRLVPLQGGSMARNFGVPRHIVGAYRSSMWPLLALALIVVGMIDAATHLRHW